MAERKKPKKTQTATLPSQVLREEIRRVMSEIDRSIERMRQDQIEIDRLKEETRAAIARLKAA
jgi:Tfp pilus assembly protein PilN